VPRYDANVGIGALARAVAARISAVTAATAALIPNVSSRALAQQRLTQAELLAFEPLGNVTLLHVTDVHGQLMPVHFREPSSNLGVGEAKGQPPHITAKDYLTRSGSRRNPPPPTRSLRRTLPHWRKATAASAGLIAWPRP